MSDNALAQLKRKREDLGPDGKAHQKSKLENSPPSGCDPKGYRLVTNIDKGSYGIVAAVHYFEDSKALYARKQLSRYQIQQEQLEREIAIIQKAKHRHVVELVDSYEDEDWRYILMRPLASANLDKYMQHIKSSQPTDPKSWIEFGSQRRLLLKWIHCLTVTLKELHSRGIRHRDIKPQNILIDRNNILLTDFGISYSFDGITKKALTTTIGTEKYEPPEASQGVVDTTEGRNRTGRLGDVFSLGCVIFEMLDTLSRPFSWPALPSVTDSYSNRIKDDEFLMQVARVKEDRRLLRKWLPDIYQLVGIPETLLENVMSGMITPVKTRKDAAAMLDLMNESLHDWQTPLSDCCVQRSRSESTDSISAQQRSDPEANLSFQSGNLVRGNSESGYDQYIDHNITSTSPVTTESSKSCSEAKMYSGSSPVAFGLGKQADTVSLDDLDAFDNKLLEHTPNGPGLPRPTSLNFQSFGGLLLCSENELDKKIDPENLRTAIRDILLGKRPIFSRPEDTESYLAVHKMLGNAKRMQVTEKDSRTAYNIAQQCIDQLIDSKVAQFDELSSKVKVYMGGRCYPEFWKYDTYLERIVIELEDRLAWLANATATMGYTYCLYRGLPILYQYGLEQFGNLLLKSGNPRLEDLLQECQDDLSEHPGLDSFVHSCKQIFIMARNRPPTPDYRSLVASM